jgi:2-oxo-4-hydroxy-4-carboxy-5-ureidoimidazoline decarboxylase
MPTLDELNALPPDAFTAVLGGIFEHAPWVAAAAAGQRPFATVTALHDGLMAALRAAPAEAQLAFLRGHPPLSAAPPAGLTAESASEQSGLGMHSLGPDVPRFEAAQSAYEARFGIPFMICVRRVTPRFVLSGLERRLANTPEQEIGAALTEIGYITRLRLVDLVTGPGMPHTSGHLSAHVLDTARGRAAEGLPFELFREGILIKQGVTNSDGRTDVPLHGDGPLRIGAYELRYHVRDYFAGWPNVTDPPWFDMIPVRFGVAEPEGHYHVPLLLGAWTYTTYRGS